MGYTVVQRIISPDSDIFGFCVENSGKAKLLYNAALYRIRNIFTGYDKQNRTANEKEVFMEVDATLAAYPTAKVHKAVSYNFLEKLMRATRNPDFFSGLPMQTAQAVVKKEADDFRNWLASVNKYKKSPEGFSGRPGMPGYKKNSMCTFTVTNQDAVLYPSDNGVSLKLPGIKARTAFSNISGDAVLKQVEIKPYYGRFLMVLVFEEPDLTVPEDMPYVCAVDFGVDNFAAIVCNDNSSALYKGGAVLAESQWFHKKKAEYTGIISKGHVRTHADSERLRNLSFHHANFVKDQCHKISTLIISYCIEHRAGTIVLGTNRFWKQKSSIGRVNNQNFVSMPVSTLQKMITYKALKKGIKVIEQEESYTSRADATSGDYIPTYGVDDEKADFSGRRIKRGLYRCGSGLVINADCNGAANIMKKAIHGVWLKTVDFSFLANPRTFGFHEVNP